MKNTFYICILKFFIIKTIGKTKCTSSAELQTTHWTCPEGHDASIPGSEAAGCTSEIQIEDICQVYGYESLSHMNNLEGLWGYEWFSDNLAMYEPTINRVGVKN